MQNTIKLSIISVALLSSLQAQEVALAPLEVSASLGTNVEQKDLTDSMTIITKEQIDEARVTNLADALNRLGGISMTQNGGAGKATSMFVRGMDTKRLLVLIDGVRYNNPTAIGAAAEFSQIMLYNVEQIEIIKGAQSGVWGSDASGGVINIITSSAQKGLHGVANVEGGSFATKVASLQASYATEDFDILIGGSYYDTDGFSVAEPKQGDADYGKRGDELGLEKDSYLNQSLNAKLGYNFTKDDRLQASVQTIDSTVNYDSGAGASNDSPIPNTVLTNRFYTLDFKHKGSMNDISINYNLSTFDRVVTYVDYYTSAAATSNYKGSVSEFKADDKISYMKNAFLRVGASYQKFEQEEITANTTKNFSAISAFLTNYNKFTQDTILTESIRYDKYDNLDDAFTGKIGAKQFVHNDIYISANVGTGFNAPTLGQLYGQWGANPDLKPETSLTSDITLGNDTLWITGFYNEITDLIEYVYDPVTFAGGYEQIAGKSKFKGVELGYKDYFLDALGINATYTYVKTEDTDGKELARRPKHQVDASMIYYINDSVDVGLNAQYIGERYDGADTSGAQTGKYTIANFVANYKLNDTLAFYGKIDNLTDKYYQIVDGYATAERSYYLGLNAKY